MKRGFLFALVGVIALAFVSCGEKQSKQFTETKTAVEELTKKVAEVTTCDNMTDIFNAVADVIVKEYDEADRMNEKEEGLIKTAFETLSTAIENKVAELGGCEPEAEETAEFDENGNPIMDAAAAVIDEAGETLKEGVEEVVNQVTDAIQG